MWATMEKLRIRSMAIVLRISRGELRCVGGKTGASAHDGAVLEDGSRGDLGMRSDADPGAYDAVAQHRSGADGHVLPEDGALPHRPRSDVAARPENGRRAHAGILLDPAGRADDDRRRDLGPGAHGRIVGDRAPIAGRPREAEISLHTTGQQIQMSLPVLGRAADIDPVAVADPAEAR